MASKGEDVEYQAPDMTRILDGLFIGNLASATSLHEHPELGITHILSVCPQNRGVPLQINTAASPPNAHYSASNPRHCSIIIDDSESQDIILHLPAAVAFIRDALQETSYPIEPTASGSRGGERGVEKGQNEARRTNHKVLVHCVMGISRSATVVCAYLMATRRFSPAQALAFVRRRRPQVHPNYGFYRQLAVYAECEYFISYPAPVRTHPAYNAWVRRKKRDISRYLARVGNVVEVDLGGGNVLSMTDDFPTDVTEAACLLGEIEATHFLTVTPSTLPPLPPPPPRTAGCSQVSIHSHGTGSGFLAPGLASQSSASGSSSVSSPTSSRSSSFSNGVSQRNMFSGPSTAATSMTSLLQPSQGKFANNENIYSEEEMDEPNFLTLTGVKHYHIVLPTASGQAIPEQADILLRLNEACTVIDNACDFEDSDCDDVPGLSTRDQRSSESSPKKTNVLVHCCTESRAALVMCAYLMFSKSMSPKNAYNKLETALPLFNATKSFLDQLELFHACDCAPNLDDPLMNAWIAAGCKGGVPDAKRARSGSTSSRTLARNSARSQQHASSSSSSSAPGPLQRPLASTLSPISDDCDSDSDDGEVLRRKIGTPARCGSFAAHMMTRPSFGQHTVLPSQFSSNVASRVPSRRPSGSSSANTQSGPASSTPHRRGSNSDMDVDALLRRVTGVGRPDFQLDVEAFRGTLRGLGLRTGNLSINDSSQS